ncbi:MAG: hypothetical protein ACREH8_11660, partial [Opitutaceae bacterium]
MKTSKAIGAGIVGALVLTMIGWIARTFMGMPVNLEMMLGTMLGLAPGAGTWIVGLCIHLTAGVVFALIYAWCFEHFSHRAGVWTGVGYGVVHAIFSGMLMAMVPMMHPIVPEQMPAPGAFMSGLGAIGVIAFVMEHLIYGGIVGGMYGA